MIIHGKNTNMEKQKRGEVWRQPGVTTVGLRPPSVTPGNTLIKHFN